MEAVQIRRTTIAALGQTSRENAVRETFQTHLTSLLMRVGRLDFAKGDLARATGELTEAVTLANQYVRLDDGLQAIYFLSLLLEKQGKWQDAEAVWQEALRRREKMTVSDPYWDLVKETAAFYARRGDFHTAADFAKRATEGTTGKHFRPVMSIPNSLESRQGRNFDGLWESVYKPESETAMAEILAMDQWIATGSDAAAPLLKPAVPDKNVLDRGSDADRGRLLQFYEQRVSLHMSILLDGNPARERIDKAYEAMGSVKGSYLSTDAEISRHFEPDRGKPNIQTPYAGMLDELAAARERRAHLFVASALDGKPFNALQFAASEAAERAVLEALEVAHHGYSRFSVAALSADVPEGAAFIDIAAWNRMDRAHPGVTQREYGAFVVRKGLPVKYVRLGAAEEIDRDIAALETAVVSHHTRGVTRTADQASGGVTETEQHLRSLYQKVIAPLETSLVGVKTLLISPDGKLTLAPISAFADAQGHRVLEGRTVTYLNSWRDLDSVVVYGAGTTTPPVIVANPDFNMALPGSPSAQPPAGRAKFDALPGAELEAGDVEQALHVAAGRVLTGKTAREGLIRSLGAPGILHFATHSIPFLQWTVPVAAYDLFEFPRSLALDNPLMQSVIALAGANRPQTGPEDGLLTGLEVASLRLSGTRLVVLSTCESGQGTPVDGQGVLGLRAAFSMAGADGVVMSLWPVDDKAGRRFMQFFYSHLDAGPAEAVRLAQVDLMTKTEFKQPFYWAGYAYSATLRQVSGEPVREPAHPRQTDESFVAPNCFQFHARGGGGTDYVHLDKIRLRIGGLVRKSQPAADRVTYQLLEPGSELEDESKLGDDQGRVTSNAETKVASKWGWTISLTVERTKSESSVSIVAGDARLAERVLIKLEGPPNLFPTFEIPAALPPLAAYTSASAVFLGEKPGSKIDSLGFCPAEP